MVVRFEIHNLFLLYLKRKRLDDNYIPITRHMPTDFWHSAVNNNDLQCLTNSKHGRVKGSSVVSYIYLYVRNAGRRRRQIPLPR